MHHAALDEPRERKNEARPTLVGAYAKALLPLLGETEKHVLPWPMS